MRCLAGRLGGRHRDKAENPVAGDLAYEIPLQWPLRRRNASVHFVGAGLAGAFGVPNTQQLLDEVHALSDSNAYWAHTSELNQRLEEAYRYFYPIKGSVDLGFRPNVVDFFSVLKTYESVSQGLPGRLEGTRDLVKDLRRALANVLVNKLREADSLLKRPVSSVGDTRDPV